MQLANLYPGTVWNETSIQAEAIKKPNLTSELNINQTKNLDSILLFRHSLSSHSSPRPLPTLRPFFYPSPPSILTRGAYQCDCLAAFLLFCQFYSIRHLFMDLQFNSSFIHGSVVQFVIYSSICSSICLLLMDLSSIRHLFMDLQFNLFFNRGSVVPSRLLFMDLQFNLSFIHGSVVQFVFYSWIYSSIRHLFMDLQFNSSFIHGSVLQFVFYSWICTSILLFISCTHVVKLVKCLNSGHFCQSLLRL